MRGPLAAGLAAAAILAGGCGGQRTPAAATVARDVSAAVRLCVPAEGGSYDQAQTCLQRRLLAIVDEGPSADELPLIDAAARRDGGFLLENCHIMMHWVGRNYAIAHRVSLGTLQHYLPASGDPGCSAGFAHGLISALAPAIRALDPASVAATCAQSPTRYEQYSCVHGLGHAYMRAYGEDLPVALRMCARLPRADVADCGQGAFHDLWFAETGADNLALVPRVAPRALCARQARVFVLPCWYRALAEWPPPHPLAQAHDAVVVCAGLHGLQRAGCIAGASVVIEGGNPTRQLAGCATLDAADAAACVRGVSTQSLLGAPPSAGVRLLGGCDRFAAARGACLRWIAMTLNVVDDGRFLAAGCPQARPPDRSACRAGAAAWRGPLETFS